MFFFGSANTHYHDTFNKYILLPIPSSGVVVKHRTKQQLLEQGHILNGFEFLKSLDERTVTEQIRDAFAEKLYEVSTFIVQTVT